MSGDTDRKLEFEIYRNNDKFTICAAAVPDDNNDKPTHCGIDVVELESTKATFESDITSWSVDANALTKNYYQVLNKEFPVEPEDGSNLYVYDEYNTEISNRWLIELILEVRSKFYYGLLEQS